MSDRFGRKPLIAGGMLLQAAALALVALGESFGVWAGAAVLLGAGTAMVYPTLLAAVGDSLIPPGGPARSASTGCGATAGSPSGPFSRDCSLTPLT